MKIIKCDDFCFRVKWGRKYIWPAWNYHEAYYRENQIPDIIEEIEQEHPRYKGKVFVFQRCIIKV